MRKLSVLGALAASVILLAPLVSTGPANAAPRKVVGWVACDGAGGVLTYKPVRHVLSCADANSGLRKLTWSTWGRQTATAAGRYYWNDCQPDCASGTTHTSKATVKLKRPRTQHGERVFTKVVVRFIDDDGRMQVQVLDSLPWQG